MEGPIAAHTLRWLDHRPIYTAPSAEFIPALYPPFTYLVQGAVMLAAGRGLPAARAVSVACSLGIGLLIGYAVRRGTTSRFAAGLAGGFFFAAYCACGAWYDQARVDMLFMLLALSSLVILTGPRVETRRALAAGVLTGLSVLTKQHGLVLLGLVSMHLLFRSRRHAAAYAGAAAGVIVPTVMVLNRISDGWFLFYVWESAGKYPFRADYVLRAVKELARFSIPLGCAVAWALGARRESGRLPSLWTWALGGFALSGFMSMIIQGGTVNHVIPVLVVALVMQGFLVARLDRTLRRPWTMAAVLAGLMIQLAVWPWPSRALQPARVREEQEKVVEELASLPGDLLVLEDSYYGLLAGKKMNPDGAALRDLGYIGFDLPEDLVTNLSSRRYAAVVLSYRVENWRVSRGTAKRLNQLILDNYVFSRSLVPDAPELAVLRVPRYLYLPKSAPL